MQTTAVSTTAAPTATAATVGTAAAAGTGVGVGGNGAGADGDSMATPLRACSTSGCRVSKYVEVTKRKCSQFVSAPYIMAKPLVVNGKTSIFQVGGEMAKMGDIPALSQAIGGGDGQPIYRIKPGTHAHVINYVFIDEGSDSMEKAKSEDQEAMRMLLDSQRESAMAKLQKLITTHRGIPLAGPATASAPSTTAADAAAPTSAAAPTPAATVPVTVAPTLTSVVAAPAPIATTVHVTTPQIHPNLSIASVEGALPEVPSPPSATPTPPAQSKASLDASVDKLQAEILKLRRTVALLSGGSHR